MSQVKATPYRLMRGPNKHFQTSKIETHDPENLTKWPELRRKDSSKKQIPVSAPLSAIFSVRFLFLLLRLTPIPWYPPFPLPPPPKKKITLFSLGELPLRVGWGKI